MMHFLVQTVDGKVTEDYAFVLLQARDYYKWLSAAGTDEAFTVRFLDGLSPLVAAVPNPDRYIPVGSVEFVSNYLRQFYPKAEAALRPLNVPERLFPYAGRWIANIWNRQEFSDFAKDIYGVWEGKVDLYRKSNHEIKSRWNGVVSYPFDGSDFRGYQVSTMLDIASEWRAFVFHDQILHLANYGGDCLLFPDAEQIREMVERFSPDAPAAYTLDVAVTADGLTVVVECHRFFSCGLYGFADLNKYPKMLSQAWYEMKTTKNK